MGKKLEGMEPTWFLDDKEERIAGQRARMYKEKKEEEILLK